MTEDTKSKILTAIAEIRALDIQECLSRNLPPNQSLEDRKIWEFNGVSIISVIARTLKQMEDFLGGEEWRVHMDMSFGQRSPIENYFSSFLTSLKTGNYSNLASSLQAIITYEIIHGIWDRGHVNVFSVDEVEIANKKFELNALLAQVNKAKNAFESRLKEIDNELTGKKSDLDAITANKTNSSNELSRIREIVAAANNDIQKQKNDFTFLYAQAEQKEKDLTEFLITSKAAQDSVAKQIGLAKENLEALKKTTSEIEKQKAEFEGYKKEAAEQVALIASAGLSGAFKRRANLMWINVGVWFVAIIAGLISSGYWLWFAFTQLPNFIGNGIAIDSVSSLLFVATSFAKIFPVYLGMSFIFKQYARERKTQEAYEFKAAVSATIKSYSDQLVAQKYALTISDFSNNGKIDKAAWEKYVDERDNFRRELIRTTVLGLYKDIEIEEKDFQKKSLKNMRIEDIKTIVELAKSGFKTEI